MSDYERAIGLVTRFMEETNNEDFWYEDQDLFLAWLSSLHGNVSLNTFTSYRRRLAQYAEYLGFDDFASAIRKVHSSRRGRPVKEGSQSSKEGAGNINDNQSAAIEIRKEHISQLGGVLMSKRGTGRRYKHGLLSLTWLQVIMMTGLRPSEWLNAQLLCDVDCPNGERFAYVLEVINADKGKPNDKGEPKLAKDGRRRLILDAWPPHQIEMLRLFMAELSADPEMFKKQFEAVRQTLIKASSVTWGSGFSMGLYTGRHVFASEVRRSSVASRYDVAALLGHSDTVNQKYYGELSTSEGRHFDYALPRPWPGAAERVEHVDRQRYTLIYGSEHVVDMKMALGELPAF